MKTHYILAKLENGNSRICMTESTDREAAASWARANGLEVQRVVCGQYPLEATEFERVEIVDQVYFRPVGHDDDKPYRMDDLKRSLEPVRSM